jgi:hypothetical protein
MRYDEKSPTASGSLILPRDTFRLLLQYLQAKMAKKPSALSIADLDAPVILSANS